MNIHRSFRFCICLGFVLALAGPLFAQNASTKPLVVNGKTADAAALQIGSHYYVDVETLALLTNGTFVADPNHVELHIPVSNAPANAAAAPATSASAAPAAKTADTTTSEPAVTIAAAPASAATAATRAAATASDAASEPAAPAQPPQGISRGFAAAAIAALADMREWRGATSAMITHGLALGDAWAASYRDQAQADLAQAELVATSDAVRNALALLRNEWGNLSSWWDGVLAARQDLNGAATIDPDALKNDSALAKIRACSQFLNSMLVSGDFADNSACH
jgi:hypothetical protein